MSHLDPRLSSRQRSSPPMDRHTGRRGPSRGGFDQPDGPRTLAPGIDTEQARYPGAANDGRIVRDRRPWYPVDYFLPPPRTWVDWTGAGPVRPELHMRTVDYRCMVGDSRSRFPFVPGAPTGGMHTMIPTGPAGSKMTPARFVASPQMTAGRPDRLANARYTGQSYSQTTAVQGRSRAGVGR